jgi:branched-chain amino acid transport system substrate-binding protein
MRRSLAGAVALGLLVVTTACGGDDETSDSSATASGTAVTESTDVSSETTGSAQTEAPTQPSDPVGEPYRLGVIAPLTGPNAAVGESVLKGVELWVKATNESGGINGRPVEFIECDDKGAPEDASACARELDGEADLYMAMSVTGAVRAVQTLLPDSLVLSISPNVMPDAGTPHFAVGASIVDTIEALFEFAAAQGIDTVGVLAATDASGEATIAPAQRAADEHGITLEIARIEPQDVEASGQLTQLDEAGVGLVYVSYSGAGAATVVQAYSNLGLNFPIVLNSASVSNAFLEVIAPYRPDQVLHLSQLGAIVPELLDESSAAVDYIAQFEAEYGDHPDAVALVTEYTADTAGAVLAAVGTDDVDAARTFLETATIESITPIDFNPDDELNVVKGMQPAVVASTRDGEWTVPEL